MFRLLVFTGLCVVVPAFTVTADTMMTADYSNTESQILFPDFADKEIPESDESLKSETSLILDQAIWPFDKKEKDVSDLKPKSTRKAFFLSLLMPGLGELYVGSKRGFIFMGVEAVAWWMYLTNNADGNDLEDEYEEFADAYWHYYDDVKSDGTALGYNYWGYIKEKYEIPDTIGPEDYELINEHIDSRLSGASSSSTHSLPSTKTQQYYEMIGKYDQFVYGWEDIDENNSSLVDQDGNPNGNYGEDTSTIESPLRQKYMDMRGESNDKLKAAQRGISIMLINRVLSAIDAGRLAYKHNQKLESDLSMVRVRVVQKHILDKEVPMVMISKRF